MTVGPILDSLHGYSTVGLSGVKIADVEPSQSFLVGIDTGGTYTDAVAYDVSTATVASKAKVATNHDDLGSSVSVALREVIDGSFVSPEQVDLVSISTTLATNAIVEGSGRPAALISIGFDEAALNRGGLMSALGGDPAISLSGGHSPHGHEAEELDLS
ncbi:MAG: hydantoinase/oxoprolinase N-terminal domain-containing protein [Actinomycetota bacterium]|nr:hydantoinase/oxoprolinase N-terminal domain-containing protein [Actinomycetota bacterium]